MAIQSAIYLAGNKRKLWEQIAPFLINTNRQYFIDVFGGSGTVTINAVNEGLFKHYVYNEKAPHLFKLQQWVKDFGCWEVDEVLGINEAYPETSEGYRDMRDDYNNGLDTPEMLYNLMCRSNSNNMRFNKQGNYNMTYGERATCNVPRVEKHRNLLQRVQIKNMDYKEILSKLLQHNLSGVLIYLDPPYLGTLATYNEQKGWDAQENTCLFDFMVQLKAKGAKVIMSNVFENRGKVHNQLIEWCNDHSNQFQVHHLDRCYNNSSFRKGKGKTDEVLIVSKD